MNVVVEGGGDFYHDGIVAGVEEVVGVAGGSFSQATIIDEVRWAMPRILNVCFILFFFKRCFFYYFCLE